MDKFRFQMQALRQGVWLVLLVQLVACNQNVANNIEDLTSSIYEPSWVYRCEEQGCQRSEVPHLRNTTLHPHMTFDSLDVCKTVCGRFGGLWPKPITAALSMNTVKIHPNYLRFDLVDAPMETRDLLVRMSHVVTSNLLAECAGNVTELVTAPVVVYISVKSPDTSLSWLTDESYALDVQNKDGTLAVHIFAESVYGARHGLESFTQLVSGEKSEDPQEKRCSLHVISGAKIRDRPVYKHRGFLLDTARNFFPMKDIKRMIDGMAASKMNVFHWHVTDSHSFPLESTRVPQFTRYGAYSSSEIYSAEEVRELVRYAQARGVRVVVEIDAPAHAGNGWQWGPEFGYGDLAVCVNAKPWRKLCIQPPCGQLNPVNSFTYKVLKDLYYDIAEVLPKPALLHVGGDEVFFNCWNSTDEIVKHLQLKGQNLTEESYIRLWSEFQGKALEAWDEALKSVGSEPQQVMIWSSALTQVPRVTKYLDPNRYVILVWEKVNNPLLNQLMRLGYKTASVPKDIWYLDHGFWGSTTYSNWRRMYLHKLPIHDNILGGEVAMWSEYVDSMTLDARVWPRAAAVAENLWSNPSSLNTAESRLERHRSRLIARGLRPDVLSPAWCAQHDGKCL